jgi:hypothetical protein
MVFFENSLYNYRWISEISTSASNCTITPHRRHLAPPKGDVADSPKKENFGEVNDKLGKVLDQSMSSFQNSK